MRIMFCLGSLGIGGAERVITNLANFLISENDVSIVVSTPKDKVYPLDKRIRFDVIDSLDEKNKLKKIINRIKKSRSLIEEINPDIIIAFLPEPSIRMAMLRKKTGVPLIISVRDDPKVYFNKLKLKIPMKFFFDNADAFVFQTEEQKKFFKKSIQEKSTIIFNPINSKFICEPFTGKRNNKIISVGRLERQKNQKLLIDAFSIVNKKHPEYELHIYGEGSLRGELQNQINSLNLGDKVFLDGLNDNLKEELIEARMFVLSSYHEGLPNALLESMAIGTPCISTRFTGGGAEAIIQNENNGLLVNSDPKSLSDAMIYYIENEDKSIEFGKNASNKMKHYTQENITNEWYKFIKKTLKKGNAQGGKTNVKKNK